MMFRSVLAFALSIGMAATVEARELARPPSCSNIDPGIYRACVGQRIATKEQRMRKLLPRARATVAHDFAEYGKWDNRTDPRFLDLSQAAWRKFVDNNCKVWAASGGGSNSAISDREAECYEDELDRRVDFLRQVADGTLRTG